jgi:hypothetical protein
MAQTAGLDRFRRAVTGLLVGLGAQFTLGMVANLFTVIPLHHPGARDPNFFGGMFHVVVWAISAGGVALAMHTALGLLLVLNAIGVLSTSLARRLGRRFTVLAVLGIVFVLAAGFNGASFLEHNTNGNSLAMALTFGAAVIVYVLALMRAQALSTGSAD